MRTVLNLNQNWLFAKTAEIPAIFIISGSDDGTVGFQTQGVVAACAQGN